MSAMVAAAMDWVQAYSFMLFTLIYTPCLSTLATIRSESRSACLHRAGAGLAAGSGVGG